MADIDVNKIFYFCSCRYRRVQLLQLLISVGTGGICFKYYQTVVYCIVCLRSVIFKVIAKFQGICQYSDDIGCVIFKLL